MKSIIWVGMLLVPLPTSTPDDNVDFVRDVRPIFESHCYDCHSGDEQESGLRLDVKSLAMKGGDNHGPDILPGEAARSPLIHFITLDADDDELMPPGNRLSDDEIAVLTRWIDQGAAWPDGVDRVKLRDRRDHWSFKPLRKRSGGETIDRYVEDYRKQAGLSGSPEVSPRLWLRRVTFDLTGLPPTPEEAQAFEQELDLQADPSGRELVYAAVVERLLASERYGERWAQHWLDVVRYADTHGFEVNTERPNAWPYRDYVIRAFNSDTPYDRFVVEQLAGDAYDEPAATGFLITASVLLPGQIGKDEPSKRLARQDSLDEIVNNISQTFLGLSTGCARCHDHKFDPITASDYYAMQAFVSGVEYAERELPVELSSATQEHLASLSDSIDVLDTRLASLLDEQAVDEATPTTNAAQNELTIEPVRARFVRFTIHDANLHPTLGLIEPCIDEFEIFSAGDNSQNVALASNGTQVSASGSQESASHQLKHINDGMYGNSRSWMSDTKGRGWVQFEFPAPVAIDRVVWSRDREGQFTDRLPTMFSLEIGTDLEAMKLVRGVPSSAAEIIRERSQLIEQRDAASAGQLTFAGKFRQPDPIYRLTRGDPEQPNEQVAPAVLSALGDLVLTLETSEQERRKQLADWIANPSNPLTARVIANRIWQGHFGTGLVATPSDFGNNGVPPSHPELLDFLAVELMENGWSLKSLHRSIVLSNTYRQAGLSRDKDSLIDADNRWLWRYPSRRLEAESIRDSMLSVSGLLNPQMYGPGFDLFNQRGGLSGFDPVETLTAENSRRMIYAHKVRREPEAVFGAFDCPDAGQSTARRRQSTTPIQALNLFNSRFTLDVSQAFAERVRLEVGSDTTAQVRRVYNLALLREPEADEVNEAAPVVEQYGLATLCRAILNCNEFLFIP